MKIHHIGVITRNIRKYMQLYCRMGYQQVSDIITDSIQKNQIVMLGGIFSPLIELIEPLDKYSTVYNFKEGYHHICYEAEPGEDIIQEFKAMKIGKIFTKPIIAPALNNREVVFACLQNGTFIEFIL